MVLSILGCDHLISISVPSLSSHRLRLLFHFAHFTVTILDRSVHLKQPVSFPTCFACARLT
eukprot:301814-Hanusia_phi.AAC.1